MAGHVVAGSAAVTANALLALVVKEVAVSAVPANPSSAIAGGTGAVWG